MRVSIVDIFNDIVEKKYSDVAVEHNEESIRYGELRKKAYSVANCLIQETNVSINNIIAVFLPNEINVIVSDIGILYSGNAFMNLDIKTPTERIQNILEIIKPKVVITNSKYLKIFENMDIAVIDIEAISVNDKDDIITTKREILIDTDPMCIINTSGSTGTPKGVVLNHRSFWDFMNWAGETFSFDGSEVIGSLSPVVFDIFVFELCMLMIKGSKIVLLDSSKAIFPASLLNELNNKEVNFIFWVPSIMVNIANLDLIRRIPLPKLKLVWFAGEVFPTKQFLYWYDNIPNAQFVNLYGPIEITLDCTYHVIEERPKEDTPLPIGKACRNSDILILNENDEICGFNEEGELCVRGTSLAMGYYNNPEKTLNAFVQNPLNNSYPELIYRTGDIVNKDENDIIHFKGRRDTLIKHMGYRIELGEIEHMVVNEFKIVNYCCALYDYQNKKIVLYYENENEITPQEFRKKLSTIFPNYMLPNSFYRMDLLPRNTNGKIDRLKLKNLLYGENAK